MIRELRKNFRAYRREAASFEQRASIRLDKVELIRDFAGWQKLLSQDGSPLDNGIPWIAFPATRFLKKHLKKELRIFEYGSGGSTLFFANFAKSLISIEHDPSWVENVKRTLEEKRYTNCLVQLIAPEPNSPDAEESPDFASYLVKSDRYQGFNFKKYVQSIDMYPDHSFDVISIDGRARTACFRHALPKLKVGGYLIWDNTDRPEYQQGLSSAPVSFIRRDFSGATPFNSLFTMTTIFEKLAAD
jgi:hypothetical protein